MSLYEDAPLYQMLKKYRSEKPLPFHMPGHVMGRGLPPELTEAGSLDITEIPGADCLHSPDGIIEKAQALAARAFGAEESFFLVNGSTSGVYAMIRAVAGPGDKLIIDRDCHRSVLYGLALVQGEPVFVKPRRNNASGLPAGVGEEEVREALQKHPDARGVLLTRPNYYGAAPNLKKIAESCHQHGIPLLVDEAHGAHFIFHPRLPETAMEQGADVCVQSLHKTLPALTQTALVHRRKGSLVSQGRLAASVSMYQTTSPSYVLMASIDTARSFMENKGEELYDNLLESLDQFDQRLSQRKGIKRAEVRSERVESDPTRLVISVSGTGRDGFQAEALLRRETGVVSEMADPEHVVLITTPFHRQEDFIRLEKALEKLESSPDFKTKGLGTFRESLSLPLPPEPERVIPLWKALWGRTRTVSLSSGEGAVCGQALVPYPPGIPLIYPGERISREAVNYLEALLKMGGTVHGVKNGKISIWSEAD